MLLLYLIAHLWSCSTAKRTLATYFEATKTCTFILYDTKLRLFMFLFPLRLEIAQKLHKLSNFHENKKDNPKLRISITRLADEAFYTDKILLKVSPLNIVTYAILLNSRHLRELEATIYFSLFAWITISWYNIVDCILICFRPQYNHIVRFRYFSTF